MRRARQRAVPVPGGRPRGSVSAAGVVSYARAFVIVWRRLGLGAALVLLRADMGR